MPSKPPALSLLFELSADLDRAGAQAIGDVGPYERRIIHVTGGRFAGPHLRGDVLPGGGDWFRKRMDGTGELDVRATLRTDDGSLIYVTYSGLTHSETIGPDGERPEGDLYFRTLPRFETSAPEYAWLNRILAVGVGAVTATGVHYDIYRVG